MTVVYVVLHYIAIRDTIECVQSILTNVKVSYTDVVNIIIVDNGSPDNSFSELTRIFEAYENVYLLKSERNVGFAKGNNIGFRYAKHQLKADFIILLNNDTVIEQANFNDLVIAKFAETQYYVLGPDIISEGCHQNPVSRRDLTYPYGLQLWIKMKLTYIIPSYFLRREEKIRNKQIHTEMAGDIENPLLHGACLIFSPLYIKQFEGLYDETFLYFEEDILKLFADHHGFLMLYSSDLKMYHKTFVSTDMIEKSEIQKIRTRLGHLLSSMKVYRRLRRELNRK